MNLNLKLFRNALLAHPEKREIVQDYEALIEAVPQKIQDFIFYRKYISNFKIPEVKYNIPEDENSNFDFDLLIKLAGASFSSEIEIVPCLTDPESCDVIIAVEHEILYKRELSSLMPIQIIKLYEIYLEEQISLEIMLQTDAIEANFIMEMREFQLSKYNKMLSTIQFKQSHNRLSKTIDSILGQNHFF